MKLVDGRMLESAGTIQNHPEPMSRRNNEFMMVLNANPGSRAKVEQARHSALCGTWQCARRAKEQFVYVFFHFVCNELHSHLISVVSLKYAEPAKNKMNCKPIQIWNMPWQSLWVFKLFFEYFVQSLFACLPGRLVPPCEPKRCGLESQLGWALGGPKLRSCDFVQTGHSIINPHGLSDF